MALPAVSVKFVPAPEITLFAPWLNVAEALFKVYPLEPFKLPFNRTVPAVWLMRPPLVIVPLMVVVPVLVIVIGLAVEVPPTALLVMFPLMSVSPVPVMVRVRLFPAELIPIGPEIVRILPASKLLEMIFVESPPA